MITARLRSAALSVAAILTLSIAPLQEQKPPMVQLDYLEIVTPKMDETVALLSEQHGITFGDPQVALGNARTARLEGGGRLSVREPMHADEQPTVRPYLRVDDIDAAYEQAETAGAEIMMPPTDIEDGARFCIYNLGGIQHGIWQR